MAQREALTRAFAYVANKRPDLASAAAKADASGDINDVERVFREVVGVIIAADLSFRQILLLIDQHYRLVVVDGEIVRAWTISLPTPRLPRLRHSLLRYA
jgi:hypothetical protein